MENHLDSILVFATNIKTEPDRQKVSSILDIHSEIHEWNVDQEDVDCVLRIVSQTLSENQIINIIGAQNFVCIPLE
jgi:predicted ATP-grasp superfamily ATP-dependent carboligase